MSILESLKSMVFIPLTLKISQLFYQQNRFIREQQRIIIRDMQTTAKATGRLNTQRDLILWRKRRKLGGVVLNKSSLERRDRAGDDSFSRAGVLGSGFLVGDAMCIFSC